MKLFLSNFSLKHPWVVILAVLAMTLGFATRFPHVTFDNDPENMLEEDEPVRLLHDDVKEKFTLFDFVIVGIVNDQHTDGISTPEPWGAFTTLRASCFPCGRERMAFPRW